MGDVNSKVQGVDYAYTLQGWIKGVNAQDTVGNLDIGQDGIVSNRVAKDAYGYSLGYYHDDYKPIGGGTYAAFAKQYTQNPGDITGQSLYNGNISTATYAIRHINNYDPVGYTYHYDQLNRLKKLRQHSSISTWNNSNINGGYSENFDYDGNGNILNLLRSGATSGVTDSLTYKYNRDVNGRLTDNKLNYLHGTGAATKFGPAQSANNYTYDPIGNLTKDTQSHLGKVAWSIYDKIDTIKRGSDTTIIYRYNTAQERISKTLTTTSGSLTTYYLRDAQGNTIALYDNKASAINWREQHLYGSSRLGMWQPDINLATGGASAKWDTAGYKLYELNNHLENVLATITDKRIANTGYYTPDITTAQDYYGFGALMPGRQFKTDSNYRYGFNGKENDNDVKGAGNQQDYGMRIYDPRVGRFLSVDPIEMKYPWFTPYQFAGDKPIAAKDVDGLEDQWTADGKHVSGPLLSNPKTGQALYNHAPSFKNPIITFERSPIPWKASNPEYQYTLWNGLTTGTPLFPINKVNQLAKLGFSNYLPKRFITHYEIGAGQTYTMNQQEMKDVQMFPVGIQGGTPTEIIAFADILGRLKQGESTYIQLKIATTAENSGTLGHFFVTFKGTLTKFEGAYNWDFKGVMQMNDVYDFDPDPSGKKHRSGTGEDLVRWANENLTGRPFVITSEEMPVTQNSSQRATSYNNGKSKEINNWVGAAEHARHQ